MAYEKQGFYSGQKLKASQLDAMEDGIIEAEVNLEKGAGASATQQLPDGVAAGFDFTGKNANATELDPTLTGIIPYGATGDFASAFGGKCAAIGKRSQAEGTTTIAKGKYSHAEGDNSVTIGNDSHAEGYMTTAFGTASHSEGGNTVAIGNQSHAEGNGSIAEGNYSHAGGNVCIAKGDCSFVGGWNTIAKANYDFAYGAYLNTNSAVQCQAAFGQYNVATQSALIIGRGADQNNRKNIFEVRQNGDICVYNEGNLYSLQALLKAIDSSIFTKVTPVDFGAETEQ